MLDDILVGIQSLAPEERIVFIGKLAKALQSSRRGGFSEKLSDEQQAEILRVLLQTVSEHKFSSGTFFCLGLLDPSISKNVIGEYFSEVEIVFEQEELHQLLISVENILDWMRSEIGEGPSKNYYATFRIGRIVEKAHAFEDEEIQESVERLAFYSNQA